MKGEIEPIVIAIDEKMKHTYTKLATAQKLSFTSFH